MRTKMILPFLSLLAACGDDATAILREIGLPDGDDGACVALGADYRNNVGTMAVVGLPSLTVVKNVLPGAVAGDPVLRAAGDRLYVINRPQASITVIDRATLSVVMQFSTGAGSNPQDIALAGNKAYVPLYDKGELQVWNLGGATAPTAPAKTIDLSSYDPDGVPQANSVVVAGGRAYVTLDMLTSETLPTPRGKGKVVVIDTSTDTIQTALELKYENPYDFAYLRGDKMIVATFADFSGQKGCLEQIATDGTPRVLDCLVENKTVNGIINAMAITSSGESYLAVSRFDAMFNQAADIHRLDATGSLAPEALTPADQVPTDLAFSPSGHLVYSDAKAGGLRVRDLTAGTELTATPLEIGLSPAAANAIVCFGR